MPKITILYQTTHRNRGQIVMIIKYVDETGHLVDLNQPNEQPGITITPDNLKLLERVYGARTDACRSRIINDLIRDAIHKIEDKSRYTN